MNYLSVKFIIFCFLFLMVYLIIPNKRFKVYIILMGNVFFYKFVGHAAFLIVLFTGVLVFLTGILIDNKYGDFYIKKKDINIVEQVELMNELKKQTIIYVWITLICIISIMFYVKIGKAVQWKEVAEFATFDVGKTVIIPLGLSYYTLSMVAYLIDIYKGNIRAEKNLIDFLACVLFFPHIVQGPISRYPELLKQFKNLPEFNFDRVCRGLKIVLWGYFKKCIIVERITLYTTEVFRAPYRYGLLNFIVVVIVYAFEVYLDFSGCMNIVSGIAEVMGIHLDKNFERPFFSRNITEFWRRWHISLGVWFRNYVYIPISNMKFLKNISKKIKRKRGKRYGQIFITTIATLSVWVLTGIWHGTGLDYMLWGLYWGVIMVISNISQNRCENIKKMLNIKSDSRFFAFFQIIRTFLIYCISVIIVAMGSIDKLKYYLHHVFLRIKYSNIGYTNVYISWTKVDKVLVIVGLCVVFIFELIEEIISKKNKRIFDIERHIPIVVRWTLIYIVIFSIILFGNLGANGFSDGFMYTVF